MTEEEIKREEKTPPWSFTFISGERLGPLFGCSGVECIWFTPDLDLSTLAVFCCWLRPQDQKQLTGGNVYPD